MTPPYTTRALPYFSTHDYARATPIKPPSKHMTKANLRERQGQRASEPRAFARAAPAIFAPSKKRRLPTPPRTPPVLHTQVRARNVHQTGRHTRGRGQLPRTKRATALWGPEHSHAPHRPFGPEMVNGRSGARECSRLRRALPLSFAEIGLDHVFAGWFSEGPKK